jgi:hypothetical protein
MRFALSLLIGVAVLLRTTPSRAQNDPAGKVKDVAGQKPTIELVFVIDTTGSMGGVIDRPGWRRTSHLDAFRCRPRQARYQSWGNVLCLWWHDGWNERRSLSIAQG